MTRRYWRVALVTVATALALLTAQGVAHAAPTYAVDNFDRSVTDHWGKAYQGGTYTLQGNAADFDVDGSSGKIRIPRAGLGQQALLPQVAPLDSDVSALIKTDKSASGSGQWAYLITRRVTPGTEYRAKVHFAPSGAVYVQASKLVSGAETSLGTEVRIPGLTHKANTAFRVRAQIIGRNPTTIRVKVWAAGTAEPACWFHSVTDSEARLQSAGAVGLRAYLPGNSTNAAVVFSFDEFRVMGIDPWTNWGVPIKDTAYSVPTGARFVSPCGSDANSGTKTAPWRTLRKAVSAAPSGSTIVLRQGVYRESVTFYNKKLTLQPFPHEQAWLKGSVIVSNWKADGATWRKDGWTPAFKRDGVPSNYLTSSRPLAGYPDMVFVNGRPLQQVASKAQVAAGKFYVDYSNDKLYIGDNPAGKTVEGAALSQAVHINQAHGTVLRGLGFAHYAAHVTQGMVKGDAAGLRFENNTFAWSAAAGLSVLGSDAVVRGNTFVYNGQLGLHGHKSNQMLVEQNTINFNNQERFNTTGAEGGIKVTSARNMTWRDNQVNGNLGHGMWCDTSCYNTTVVRNVMRNNLTRGIEYEISSKAIIASNLVVGNGDSGMLLNESGDLDVYNNTLSRNRQNIRVWEGLRAQNVFDVVIRNNIMSNARDSGLLGVVAQNNLKSASAMGVSTNYNAYYRTSSSSPTTLAEWAGSGTVARYNTFGTFKQNTGQEAFGFALDNLAINPFFVDETKGDYKLKLSSVAIRAGQALPAPVATAIGVAAGVPVNLGRLR